jgi:predicted site-specific integrase-resolvase
MDADRLVKPKDAAAALGLHVETLYRWMRLGLVKFVFVGPSDGRQRRGKRIRASEISRLQHDPRNVA